MRNSFLSWSAQFCLSLLTLLPYSNQKSFRDHWRLPQFATHSTDPEVSKRQFGASGSKTRIKSHHAHSELQVSSLKPGSLWRRQVPRGDLIPYLPEGMLEQGGMANKANIINLQFKLFATHIWLGSQNCCQDDIRKPWRAETEVTTVFKKHTS